MALTSKTYFKGAPFYNALVSICICHSQRLRYGERFAGPRQACLYFTTFFRYP